MKTKPEQKPAQHNMFVIKGNKCKIVTIPEKFSVKAKLKANEAYFNIFDEAGKLVVSCSSPLLGGAFFNLIPVHLIGDFNRNIASLFEKRVLLDRTLSNAHHDLTAIADGVSSMAFCAFISAIIEEK